MTDVITAANYEESFRKHGASPKAMHWANYRVSAVRYSELVRDVPVNGKTILDAGCGMGDLIPFLYAKSPDFKYLGMDINEQFIKVAKKRYEGHDFEVGDAFNDDVGRFDVVVSCGVLNGNVENWMEKRKKAITSLFEKANEVLAFNMSGSVNPIPNTEITAFADLKEIFEFCSSLTPRVILRSQYSERGFTIVLFK
ncbi:methyltransferase domain-containing protein [Candidatus Saccharibacteria bacterium]|nr:methyltransferase domain-containing protein [Candidatus Saccharibacteria bacterium]